MNRVVLIGRLTKDPELRTTEGGTPVTNFVLAVDRPFKNAQGEREADFISIVVWRKLAENVCNYVGKGRLIAVEGRIQTRSYDNNEGKRVYVTEVVAEDVRFLDRPKDNEQQRSSNATYNQGSKPSNASKPVQVNKQDEEEDDNELFKDLSF